MGMLVDGVWKDVWYDTKKSGGRFERSESQWRDWVTVDGSPAEGRSRGFPPRADAIIFMSRSRVRGRIARLSCAL